MFLTSPVGCSFCVILVAILVNLQRCRPAVLSITVCVVAARGRLCVAELVSVAWCCRCERITDAGLEALRGMPLTYLSLANNRGFTGRGLESIKTSPLARLRLGDCSEFLDEGLLHLKNMPLTSLDLSRCSRVTDVGLAALHGMPLTDLGLGGVPVTSEALFSFLYNTPTLEEFDFSDVRSVSIAAEARFWKYRYLNELRARKLLEIAHGVSGIKL